MDTDKFKISGNNLQKYLKPVYAIVKDVQNTLSLTESSLREEKIKELVEYISASNKERGSLAIRNIIDLNVIPINVHALMREIPLVNIYNYAYTFDRLIIELYYGLGNANANKLIRELCRDTQIKDGEISGMYGINSAKDMLVAMLISPYMQVDTNKRKLVGDMLIGVGGDELGRPKFLSDQLYGKLIFGELYESNSNYNESGPAAGRVTTQKITDGILLKFAVKILVEALHHCAHAANIDFASPNILKYVAAICSYAYEHPSASVASIEDLINKKFFDATGGVAIFKALVIAAGGAAATPQDYKDVAHDSAEYARNIADRVKLIKEKRTLADGIAAVKTANLPTGITGPNMVAAVDAGVNNILKLMFISKDLTEPVQGISEFGSRNSYLHYLDEVQSLSDERMNEFGSVLEPDNANVLDSDQVHKVDVGAIRDTLITIGALRFNTVFVRNLIFIVNLYRTVRLKLHRDLVYSKDIITRSAAVTRDSLTEFRGNRVDRPKKRVTEEGHPHHRRYERHNY